MAGLPDSVTETEALGRHDGQAAPVDEPLVCLDLADGMPITAAELDILERYFADLIDAALGR